MINDKTLEALDQAERAATPEPWERDGVSEVTCADGDVYFNMTLLNAENNAHFIALSRNFMRELLDEVRMWRNHRLKEVLDEKVPKLSEQLCSAEHEKLRAELEGSKVVLHSLCYCKEAPPGKCAACHCIKRIDAALAGQGLGDG